jgi:hypothetical protein
VLDPVLPGALLPGLDHDARLDIGAVLVLVDREGVPLRRQIGPGEFGVYGCIASPCIEVDQSW